MTYNIKYDHRQDTVNNWQDRKEKLTQLIRHYAPSFVGIQEGLSHQVSYLDSILVNYQYIGVGRTDGKLDGEFCAIFYDSLAYKNIKSGTFWLSETPENQSVGWDAAFERICTYGLFEHKGSKDKIWIFNTHFDHIGQQARKNASRLILKKTLALNTEDIPLVLMGDFNLEPEEEPVLFLKKYLDDAFDISKIPLYGPQATFNGFNNSPPERRIDYLFTHKLTVLSYKHIDDRLDNNKHISDHYPVLIETTPQN